MLLLNIQSLEEIDMRIFTKSALTVNTFARFFQRGFGLKIDELSHTSKGCDSNITDSKWEWKFNHRL